jgi:hypothetical protein
VIAGPIGAPDHPSPAPRSVAAALASLGGDPRQWIGHWNWKAALTSSLVRGGLFFAVNLTASLEAAQAALVTELFLRAITSGFYGAVTQRFRHVEPHWAATATVSILLPIASQTIELGVHWLRGTEALLLSVAASVLLTIGSSAFNLHLMRHGVLTVGAADSQSLLHDLRRLPVVMLGFIGAGPTGAGRYDETRRTRPPQGPPNNDLVSSTSR